MLSCLTPLLWSKSFKTRFATLLSCKPTPCLFLKHDCREQVKQTARRMCCTTFAPAFTTFCLLINFGVQARLGEVNQPEVKQEDNAHALMQRSYPEGSTSRRWYPASLPAPIIARFMLADRVQCFCVSYSSCDVSPLKFMLSQGMCCVCSSDQSGSPRAHSTPDLPLVSFVALLESCTVFAFNMGPRTAWRLAHPVPYSNRPQPICPCLRNQAAHLQSLTV